MLAECLNCQCRYCKHCTESEDDRFCSVDCETEWIENNAGGPTMVPYGERYVELD